MIPASRFDKFAIVEVGRAVNLAVDTLDISQVKESHDSSELLCRTVLGLKAS